ncbi:MAG: YfhO family protein [Prevotella sp.]|nr:YfhO family protein [Prevotella sp.]MDY5665756.1 YfhO family protein [Alloprevotella sp.]
MQSIFKKIQADLLVVLIFLAVSVAYFISPLSEGLVLGGHDSVAAVGLGQEQKEYRATHGGETTRWSNAIFSGMPTYQTAPTYSATDTVSALSQIYGLGTGHWFPAISYLFLYLLGFYILLRAFNFKPYLAALGAVLWAFSSYFMIIIAAGHIWKVMTLAFIPPTIGGLILCYRGKYLWGAAVTALFTAFQVMSNHMQMTYYFLFVMLFLVIAYFVDAIVRHKLGSWLKATAVLAVAGVLGVAANLPNIYHTYEYAKESMRGKAELTPQPAAKGETAQKQTDGLDRDYITMWSYGIDETLTLLVPDYKGGGSQSILDRDGVEDLPGYDDFYQCAGQTQAAMQQANIQAYPPGVQLYWGDQPFTVGPVYIGAFVCFLFILGLFYVKGPVKWGLLAATLLSLLFAWGKNIGVTDFFIDHLPMYAKFRTVSSALVIAEFTMPLLAVLCLYEISRNKQLFNLTSWKGAPLCKRIGLPVASVLTLGLSLLLWVAPGVAGDCISTADMQTFDMMRQAGFPADLIGRYMAAITSMHHAILSADALRSACIIVLGMLVLWAYATDKLKGWMCCSLLALICLADLWQIDKRYLNDDSFTDETTQSEGFAKSPADARILQDKSYYRVLNLSTGGSPFNETTNATSYYHHSIGGYHAAKLHRYQDLIDRQLNAEIQHLADAINNAEGDMTRVPGDSVAAVLNMLNTKYIMFGKQANQVIENPYANGNGWFVRQLNFVKNADAEMAALGKLDTKHVAVADEKFRSTLDGTALDSGSVSLQQYAPNDLKYTIESAKGGLVVFSEIYYPGWTVTIDGKPAELGRVNYVLRALKVPAGKHEVQMTFRPASITTTNTIAYVALLLVVALFAIAVWRNCRKTEV